MNRASRSGIIGLGAAVILLLPAHAHAANDMKCYQHTIVRANQRSILSSSPAKVCMVEVRGGIGHADIIDSPNGLGTHASAVFIAEPSNGTAGAAYSTGRVDTLTTYGLSVESSNVTVTVHWDNVDR